MDVSRARTRDPDEWIAQAPAFSRLLAEQVREWILRWQPDLVESIKWNTLCYSGRKQVCALSACKNHLGITFFRGTELAESCALFDLRESNTSIQSIRLTSLQGFDAKAFRQLLHAAVALDERADLPPPPPVKREEWPMPEALAEGLRKNKAAAAFFNALKPTYQREYKVWVGTAKQPETIKRRLHETLTALAAGRKWAQRKG
ncbi:MAG: YdeI/OmpD-associated family protein [Prosthecobacter sp.]|nr:YdeI/OmpD-associated family protein [Prosthecobacter sp.]